MGSVVLKERTFVCVKDSLVIFLARKARRAGHLA